MSIELLNDYEAWRGGREHKPKSLPYVDLFATLMAQDEILVRGGMPPLPDWWRYQFQAFYRGGFRRFIARVGRKGTKSSSVCRAATNELLNNPHNIHPGDLVRWPLLSVDKKEAKDRLTLLKAILSRLGHGYESRDGDLQIEGTQLAFSVRAATVGGVSGPISCGFTLDELAKWRDKESEANPAADVIASLKPSTATQPNAHEFWISSPFSEDDPHFEAMARGTIPGVQYCCEAPTWAANPDITEAYTHELEPDDIIWQREYGIKPMRKGASKYFDPDAIKIACELGKDLILPRRLRIPGEMAAAGGDVAFVRDCAAVAIVHRQIEVPDPMFFLAQLDERRPEKGKPLKPRILIKQFADIVAEHGLLGLMVDEHYIESVREHLEESGLELYTAPGGNEGKSRRYSRLRVILHGGRFTLPHRTEAEKRLVQQLKDVYSEPLAGGAIKIVSPRNAGGHGDDVSALEMATWNVSQGETGDYQHLSVKSRWAKPETADERRAAGMAPAGELVDDADDDPRDNDGEAEVYSD